MSLTAAQIALFLQTLQDIERHLAVLAHAAQERTRLAGQADARPL
jgi:hypothetical protein